MVDLAGAAVVAVLTRAPSSGGKSRLFAALRRDPDPSLLAALLLDTLDAAALPGVVRVVAVDPPQACGEVRALAPGIEVIPQIMGTLGERMEALLRTLLARGARAVALVGSDLPDLDPAMIAAAFHTLAANPDRLVLGPALDGGYYLIGATAAPDVFRDVPWGTGDVLAQTVAEAERLGLVVQLLDPLGDVDTVEDLRRVRASRTRAWVRRHTAPPAGP